MRILAIISINLYFVCSVFAQSRGIYITQYTLENTKRISALIREAKDVGINTFVIDLQKIRKQYDRNIQLVLNNHIKYVARIVVFPDGGNQAQIDSPAIRQAKLKLIQHAEKLGASEIQLDYIRYNTKNPSSQLNAHNIKNVISWFKNRCKVPLQIAVFGETTFGPSNHIGQNLKLFSPIVDTIAPMLYPSHFEPKAVYSYQPYNTIKKSLDALIMQFNGNVSDKVITYIETSNYRRSMSFQERADYIRAQLQAVRDANLHGWYAWSANNYYQALFGVLKSMKR